MTVADLHIGQLTIEAVYDQERVLRLAFPSAVPAGAWTLHTGSDLATSVTGVVDGTDDLVFTVPAATVNVAIDSARFVIRQDGADRIGGPVVRAAPQDTPGALTVDVVLADETVVTVSTVYVAGDGVGGPDHTVDLIVEDADLSGGTFTELVAPGVDTVFPRYFLDGTVPGFPPATVALASGTDVEYLWTVTVSGPCIQGALVSPGEQISSVQGQDGTASKDDVGGTITDHIVMAVPRSEYNVTAETVAAHDGVIAANTAFVSAAQVDNGEFANSGGDAAVSLLTSQMFGLSSTRDALRGTDHTPTQWLQSGLTQDECWQCPTNLPAPTSTLRIRTLARVNSSALDSGNKWQEVYTVSKDGTGAVDIIEVARHSSPTGLWTYLDLTEQGGAVEVMNLDGALTPAQWWVWDETAVDFTTGTVTFRVRCDVGWDYENPDDGTHWVTTRVAELGRPFALSEPTIGIPQWIGNGNLSDTAAFLVGRVQRWDDGVLVLDMDPSTGTLAAQTIDDTVLKSSPGVPAVWTVSIGTAAIANA